MGNQQPHDRGATASVYAVGAESGEQGAGSREYEREARSKKTMGVPDPDRFLCEVALERQHVRGS
jgi:hypothetical protein